MLRRCLSVYRRKDVAEIFLHKSRLMDIPFLNFFNAQVSRQLGLSMDTEASPAAKELSEEAKKVEAVRRDLFQQKKESFDHFQNTIAKVKKAAETDVPSAWLKEVFTGADQQWSSSYLSALQCRCTPEGSGDSRLITGVCTVTGATGTTPVSAQLIAVNEKTGKLELLRVQLNATGVETKPQETNLALRLKNAKGERIPLMRPLELATQQHVLSSVAYQGIIERVQQICALHATHHVQYDSLLIRNKLVQKQLAELECFTYGLQALTDYVVGQVEVEEEEVQSVVKGARTLADLKTRLPEISVLESLMLNVYAERVLMDTISHAWSIVRGVSLSEAVLHRSTVEGQTPITIDYPYLQHLFGTSKYALTAADGQMEAQLLAFVGPFLQLRVDPTSAAKDNLLKELECDVADEATTAALAAKGNANPLEAALTAVTDVVRSAVGLTGARSVRFTAPHMNLSIVTSKLEKDIAEFLSLIEKRIHACRSAGSGKNIMKDDIMFVLAVGEYLSEVLATVAVLYRSTAMLQLDDHGGHREWLLAQSFCASSEERRKKLLFELRLQSSAEKVLQTTNDLDNYSTHPAVLMNAAARPAKEDGEKKKATAEK